MNKMNAASRIQTIFSQAKAAVTTMDAKVFAALSNGKLLELYVLSEVLTELRSRHCPSTFKGSSFVFKAGPGMIKLSDPHFEVQTPSGLLLRLFVDIEFRTLGSMGLSPDDSCTHELDIILTPQTNGYPKHSEIWLGVECKSTAKFTKALVKEVLGVRRELGYLSGPHPSLLSLAGAHPKVDVPAANPAAEVWLAYLDPKGDNYRRSPEALGIQFRHFNL